MDYYLYGIIKWLIIAAMAASVAVFSVRSIRRMRPYDQPARRIALFLSVPFFEVLLIFTHFSVGEQGAPYLLAMGVLLLAGSIILNRAIYTNIGNMLEKLNMEEEMTELYNQRQMESDYYDMVSEGAEEMRMLRHEFSNQLQTAYSLLKEEDGSRKAKEVLDEIRVWLDSASMKRYCDDPMVNAIFTVQTQHFAEEGIEVDCSADLTGNLKMKETDLFGIIHQIFLFGKICLPKEENATKALRFSIGQKSGFVLFFLEIMGDARYDEKEKLPIVSAALKKYIDRYHGSLKTEITDHISVRIVLEEEV